MLKLLYKFLSVFLAVIILCISFLYLTLFVWKKYVYKTDYIEYVIKYSNEYNVDPYLVFAVIKTESNFNEKAVSNKGAIGLMQIIPSTGEFIAKMLNEKDFDLFCEETNIRFGCKYLSYLYNKYIQTDIVLACYNAGEGNVCRWLKDKNYSIDGKTLIQLPFGETITYLKKVNKNLKKYQKLYPDIVDK